MTFAAPVVRECGLHLLTGDEGDDGISITSGAKRTMLRVGKLQAPFKVKPGEDLTLRVFIDKNLIEVFANDRQAVVFAHKHIRKQPNVRLYANGGDALVKSVKAWKMKTIYQTKPAP